MTVRINIIPHEDGFPVIPLDYPDENISAKDKKVKSAIELHSYSVIQQLVGTVSSNSEMFVAHNGADGNLPLKEFVRKGGFFTLLLKDPSGKSIPLTKLQKRVISVFVNIIQLFFFRLWYRKQS